MKEHYFIVKWSRQNGWELDPTTEEAKFPDGTMWNGQEWEYAYLGEGNYNDNNDLVGQDLEVILSEANEREGESKWDRKVHDDTECEEEANA